MFYDKIKGGLISMKDINKHAGKVIYRVKEMIYKQKR